MSLTSNNFRIGIDARFYGPLGKGLGRYTQEVVDRIIAADRDNEYVVFLGQENFAEFRINSSNVKKVLANVRWYTLKEQIVMPWLIWRQKVDLMHFPHFNVPILCPAKFLVTIHDLILFHFPTRRASTLSPFLYGIKNIGYRIVISLALLRAKKVLAVSQFTKSDIIAKFNFLHPDKISVTYEGVSADIAKSDNAQQEQAKFKYFFPYFLYVGNAYPHKNLEMLISAFREFNQEHRDYRLVLVGKDDYFYLRLKQYALELGMLKEDFMESEVIFPGFVPDKELALLYRNAKAYVFPSLYEGFGLPPLDAMSYGCPVLSSNASCLPEILGDAVLYFDPNNKEEIAGDLNQIIENKELIASLVEKGYGQAKKYSWEECAQRTKEEYLKILNSA